MSYIRILYRCETYFTGKTIWYQFHAFLILSPKFGYSSTLTWPPANIEGSRNNTHKASSVVARRRSYEVALYSSRQSIWWKTRLWFESSTDARLIQALVWTRLHDQFDLILTPIFCCSSTLEMISAEIRKEKGRINTHEGSTSRGS